MCDQPCIEMDCHGEDWCAITCAAALVGRKWHPVIIHRLLQQGPMRFNELRDAIDGITNKVLSNNLDALEANGLVHRDIIDDKPVKVEYSLTDLGASLEPVIDALQDWGSDHITPPEE